MRIRTKEDLREYIKRRLGAPLLNVELTEDMLDDCIDKAIEIYSNYGYDGTTEEILVVNLERGKMDYKLPDEVIAVTGLQASSTYSTFINIPAGYTLAMNPISLNIQDSISTIDIQSMTSRMSKMSNLRGLFDVNINFDFNSNTKILRFFEEPMSSVAILELGLEYSPGVIDAIFNHQWIKKRAEGEAWIMWSTIMGKYSSSLVNGSEINYADMRDRGNDLIEKSDEELLGLFEPLGVYVF